MLRIGPKKRSRTAATGLAPHDSPSLVRRRRRLQRIVVVGAFVVLVLSVTEFRLPGDQAGRYDIDAEAVASHTIQAAFAFESEDLKATHEKKDEAAAQVPLTYTPDSERTSNQLLTLQQRITILKDRRSDVDKALRNALLESTSAQAEEEIVDRVITQLSDSWKADPLFEGFPDAQFLKTWLLPDPDTIPKRIFADTPTMSPDEGAAPRREVTGFAEPDAEDGIRFANIEPLTQLALDGLRYVLTEGVRQQGGLGTAETGSAAPNIVILRPNIFGDLKISEERLPSTVPDPIAARANLRTRIGALATRMQEESQASVVSWESLQSPAYEMARSSVSDTLIYEPVVTEGNRELARSSVEPVMQHFDANQIIQQEGYRWTEQARHDVRTYWGILEGGEQRTRSIFSPIAANMIFVALLLIAFTRAVPVLADRHASAYASMNVAMLIICSTLVLGRVIGYLEPSGLLVPLAASAMLLTILTNPRLASITTLTMAILLSIQYRQDWRLLMVSGAMAFSGIVSLYTVRRRTDMARSALRATAVGLLTALAIALAAGSILSRETMLLMGIIVLNGIACLFIVPGLLSPLERLFGITTDIQLLEYSDLNNEILSRLAIEVPATYAHSLMMGQLAEAAADAIGANGLMARVCAYYHDIGKLRRPEYFSENQTGYNIHEDLSPRLSARAIASHVTEGVEIAREFHLPQPIVRGILEHHGTQLISFFHQQALDQQKHGDVREEDFRYPGPKPQSPETAILMICDGVESGVRTIKNPNEERIREFIGKIIQSRSADRQFDECDLTLKKLDIIGEVLTKRIMTTMHTRIAYPERPSMGEADNVIRMSGHRD